MTQVIIHADCRTVFNRLADGSIDCVVTDPPYGETSLAWDKALNFWLPETRRVLKRSGSVWVFGSFKSLRALPLDGWNVAQDLVWEKHNGSNAANDRFRRVHEFAIQLYRDDVKWTDVYKKPLFTNDARAKVVRRKQRPPQWGEIADSTYVSTDGGPRLMRSVMFCRSEHGRAEHPTQKPVAVITPLIEYSCPPDGVVFDPFAGSGTTAVAAKELGCRCIAVEIDEAFAAIGRRRLA